MAKTISPFSKWHFQTLMQGITTHHEVAYNKRLKQGVKGKAFYDQSSLLGYSKWKKPWRKKTHNCRNKDTIGSTLLAMTDGSTHCSGKGPPRSVPSRRLLRWPDHSKGSNLCSIFTLCVSSASSSAGQALSQVSLSKSLWPYEWGQEQSGVLQS